MMVHASEAQMAHEWSCFSDHNCTDLDPKYWSEEHDRIED